MTMGPPITEHEPIDQNLKSDQKFYRDGIKMKHVYFWTLTNNMGSKFKMADRRG